jgi:hypothetical protein
MNFTLRNEFRALTRPAQSMAQQMISTGMINSLNKSGATKLKDSASVLFATNGFEKIDVKLNKPKYKYFYAQEMPIVVGGGAIDSVAFLRQTFSKPDPYKVLASGTSNQVYMVDERTQKINTPVQPIILGAELGLIDQMRYAQVGYDYWASKLEAVQRAYHEALDEMAFHGYLFSDQKYYGLYNNPEITRTDATANWSQATADDLVKDILGNVIGIVKDLGYETDVYPNHISVPIDLYQEWAKPMAVVGRDGSETTSPYSVLEYLEKQLSKLTERLSGSSIRFYPSRFLAKGEPDHGTNSEGRIVIMCRDESVFRMPIPMPLTQGSTLPLGVVGINTYFVAFVGAPQFIWSKGIRYLDNIAPVVEGE